MTAVPLLPKRMRLGESIIWDELSRMILWVDVGYPSYLYLYDPAQDSLRKVDYAGLLCGVALTNRPDTVILLADSFLKRCHLPSGHIDDLMHVDPDCPSNICNECGVDMEGCLWVATMQNNMRPEASEKRLERSGSLYQLRSGELVRYQSGLGIPNTLLWSSNGKRFYMGDSLDGKLFCYDVEGDSLSNKRELGEPHVGGVPDGSAMDSDDNLWNARWGDAAVFVYSSEGRRIKTIPIPTSQVTSCTFGGPDMSTLFVTTAQHELSPAERAQFPLSGTVFKVETSVRGKTRGRVKL